MRFGIFLFPFLYINVITVDTNDLRKENIYIMRQPKSNLWASHVSINDVLLASSHYYFS